MRPQIGAHGLAPGKVAKQLEVVLAEDREIIARSKRMMTALCERKPEPLILCRGFIELAHHVDHHVIEDRTDFIDRRGHISSSHTQRMQNSASSVPLSRSRPAPRADELPVL